MDIAELQKLVYRISADKGFHDTDSIEGVLTPHGFTLSMIAELEEILGARWNNMQDSLRLLLAIGELIEAHEELRADHAPTEIYYPGSGDSKPPAPFTSAEHDEWVAQGLPAMKPEGVPIELADAVIRIADYAESRGIDLAAAIELKAAYNTGRPHMHGKRF